MNLFTKRWPLIINGHLFFILLSAVFYISSIQCQPQIKKAQLITGADRLLPEFSNLLVNKKIGVIFNQTSRLSNGVHLLDTLSNLYNVINVFSPEHGFKGNIEAGKKYSDSKIDSSQFNFYSLYGTSKKPTKEMLQGVDLLIYDLQDIGVRYYTYISTLFYVMEAASENNIPLIILDRPNPLGGSQVEGPILKNEYLSFIGIAPIAVRYGLTSGELAKYFLDEGLIKNGSYLNLRIIELKNWKRKEYFDFYYGNNWQKTSPNIPNLNTAIVYPGTCLIEGTNISEGRGTFHPFLQIGAPFINSDKLITELNKFNIKGVKFTAISFIPKSIPEMVTEPKYKNEKCNGIFINITERYEFNSVNFGIKLISAIYKLYKNEITFNEAHFNKLIGNNITIKQIKDGIEPDIIIQSWHNDLNNFNNTRQKYLLY